MSKKSLVLAWDRPEPASVRRAALVTTVATLGAQVGVVRACRILAAEAVLRERRNGRRHPHYAKPERTCSGDHRGPCPDPHAAFTANPLRFKGKPPTPKLPPAAVWINPPAGGATDPREPPEQH